MKRKLMFLALAAIGLASCNGGFKKGANGLLYKIVTDKSGPSIQPGDGVAVNYIVKNDADSVLANSYDIGSQSMQILPKPASKGDVLDALFLLSEGDSAFIKTNIDSLSKGRQRPAGFKGKYITYIIKVEKVIAKGNLSDEVFQGRWAAFKKTAQDAIMAQEPVKIKKYIADNNLKVTTTASGLNYVITQKGTGPMPAAGDTVVVNYTGKMLSGKIFETNVKAVAVKEKLPINPMNPFKPIRFPIGVGGMIAGWNEALPLFTKGAKGTLILPSNLAYGERGNGPIGPFTSLVFDIELVDIVHPNPNAPKPVAPAMPQVQVQPQPVKK
jgi:FKBP-type peptidyl-prolyl cis-trans isomerase FkpA